MQLLESAEVPDRSTFQLADTPDEVTPAQYQDDNTATTASPSRPAEELLYAEGQVNLTCRPQIDALNDVSCLVHVTGAAMHLYFESQQDQKPATGTACKQLTIDFAEIILHATTTTQQTAAGAVPSLYMHIEPSKEGIKLQELVKSLRPSEAAENGDSLSLEASSILEITLTPGPEDGYLVAKLYSALSHMANILPAPSSSPGGDTAGNDYSSLFQRGGDAADDVPSGQWITADNAHQFMDA
ncbi:hypothetical protein BCR37DRAFT_382029, partial [Protomyces lactucae-debilis]